MPRLVNKVSGETKNFSQDEILRLVSTGKWTLDPTEIYRMYDTAGGLVTLPGEVAVNVLGDYAFEPDGDRYVRARETAYKEAYEGGLNKLQAGFEAAARGATFGGSDYALRALGASKSGLAGRRAYHPGTSTIMELGGAIVPGLISGGASMGASAGRAAKVARATPAGLAATIAPRIERLAARRGVLRGLPGERRLYGAAKGAEAAGKTPLAARIGGIGLEGAVFGVGDSVGNISISQDPMSVDAIISELGTGALYGGVLGAGIGGIGAVVSKGMRRTRGKAAEKAAFAETAEGVEEAAVKHRLRGEELEGVFAKHSDAIGAMRERIAGREMAKAGLGRATDDLKTVVKGQEVKIRQLESAQAQISKDFTRRFNHNQAAEAYLLNYYGERIALKGAGPLSGDAVDALGVLGKSRNELDTFLKRHNFPTQVYTKKIYKGAGRIAAPQAPVYKLSSGNAKKLSGILEDPNEYRQFSKILSEHEDSMLRVRNLIQESGGGAKGTYGSWGDVLARARTTGDLKGALAAVDEDIISAGNVLRNEHLGPDDVRIFLENNRVGSVSDIAPPGSSVEALQNMSAARWARNNLYNSDEVRAIAAAKSGMTAEQKAIDRINVEIADRKLAMTDVKGQIKDTRKLAVEAREIARKVGSELGLKKSMINELADGAVASVRQGATYGTYVGAREGAGMQGAIKGALMARATGVMFDNTIGIISRLAGRNVAEKTTNAYLAAQRKIVTRIDGMLKVGKAVRPAASRTALEVLRGARFGKPIEGLKGKGESKLQTVYAKRFDELRASLSGPAGTEATIRSRLSGVAAADELFANAIAQRSMLMLRYLLEKAPRMTEMGHGVASFPPSETEISKFARIVDIFERPSSIFPKISDGTATIEEVEAFRIFFPTMFETVQTQLFNRIADVKSMPYEKRVELSYFFDIPLDPLMTQDSMLRAQQMFVPQEAGGPPPPKLPSFTGQIEEKYGTAAQKLQK